MYDKAAADAYPWYAGFLPPVVNNYEYHTYGAEFNLGYRTKIGKELSVSTSVNFAFGNGYASQGYVSPYKLYINTYQQWQYQIGTNFNKWNDANFGLKTQGMFRTQAEVDAFLRENPTYTIYGKVPEAGWLYYEDTNQDGIINDTDFVPMFERIDPIQFGITLGFKYKAFALNTNIVANIGGKEFYDDRSMEKPTITKNASSFFRDYWTPQNTNAQFPRYDDPGFGRPSDFWAVDATMIRINNMDLSYTLPSKYAVKLGLSNVRVLVTGNNLWTIVNPLKFKDPYQSSIYDYPTIRTISFGLSFGF